jgi:hypothetical protein
MVLAASRQSTRLPLQKPQQANATSCSRERPGSAAGPSAAPFTPFLLGSSSGRLFVYYWHCKQINKL